jgi:hypothetical protein
MIRSKKITQSAKGEECAMNGPICNYIPETVVWCHSNYGEDGKGKGVKSHDIYGFYGCSHCHAYYDGRDVPEKAPGYYPGVNSKQEREYWFYRAMKRSWLRLIEKGIILIK